MSKASEAGKTFLAGVLAKLTPEQRGQAEAVFNAAEATQALEVLGTGTLGQSEINRQLDELRTQREALEARQTELTDWFEVNKDALVEYKTIKPEYDTLKTKGGGGGGGGTGGTGLTKDDVQKELSTVIEQNNRAFAGALALATDLSARHYATFTEPLNTTELLADPNLGQPIKGDPSGRVYGLQDAYNTKHGARVLEKQTAAEAARIQKLVDEGVNAKLKTMPQNMQHPFPLRDPSPSPLDALNAERKPADFSVDTAVAEYERLQTARPA